MAESYSVDAVFSLRDQMSAKLKTITDRLGEAAEKPQKISAGFGTILKGAGVFAVVRKGVDLVTSSLGGAISRIDTLNNSDRVFSNMGFSADETRKMMDDLQGSIKGLPTPLNDAVQGVQLIASSTDDLGKSQKIWSALNDGIIGFGGTTGQVQNAIVQLSQAFSNGKIDAQSWNSMIQSGLGPALSAIAKQMGITTGALKGGLSEGSISVGKFQDALIDLDQNGGGGIKSLQTIVRGATAGIGTSFENAKTAITRGTATITKAFSDVLKSITGVDLAGLITKGGEVAEKALNSLSSAIERTGKVVAPYVEAVKQAFGQMGPAVSEAIQAVVDSLSVLNNGAVTTQGPLNTFKGAMNGIVGVVKQVSAFIRDNSDKVAELIRLLPKLVAAWVALKVVNSVTRTIKDGITVLIGSVINFVGRVQNANEKVINVFTAMGKSVSRMASPLKKLGENFAQAFADNKLVLGSTRTGAAVSALGSSISSVYPKFTALAQSMRHPITSLQSLSASSKTFSGISSTWTGILVLLGNGFKGFASIVSSAIKKIVLALASNPVGAILIATVAVVAAVAAAWKRNLGNIQAYVRNAFNAIKSSLASIGHIFDPMLKSFGGTSGAMKVLAKVAGSILVGAFKGLAVAVGVVVDIFRGMLAAVATVVIAIQTVITMIGKFGSALGKAAKGDFNGAFDDVKGSIGSIGDGIGRIKDTWAEFGKGSATAGVIGSFDKSAKAVNKVEDSAKKANTAFKGLSDRATKASSDILTSFQDAGQSVSSAFDSDRMTQYATSAQQIMDRYSDSVTNANAKIEEAEKAHGTKRVTLLNKALTDLNEAQSAGNVQMQALMSDNSRMLEANKDLEGNTLTEQQRTALQNQNDVIREGLIKQQQLYVDAAQAKLTNGQKLSEQERTAVMANLTALYQNQGDAIVANETKQNDLKNQLKAAQTESERANIQAELAQIDADNASRLEKQTGYGIQMLGMLQQQGQLNGATVAQNLSAMHITTDEQLDGIYQSYVSHGASMDQQLQLLAGIMKQRGVEGSSALMSALKSGDFSSIGQKHAEEVAAGLAALPPSMFTGGQKGRDDLVAGLKDNSIKVSDAGSYLARQGADGTGKRSDLYGKNGTSAGKEFGLKLESMKGAVEDKGDTVAYHGAKGTSGHVALARSNGKNLGLGVAQGMEDSIPAVKRAADAIVSEADRAAKAKAKIHSPSRLFRDNIGRFISLGVAQGINDYSGEAETAAANMIARTNAQASANVGFSYSGTSSVDLNAGSGLMSMLSTIVNAINSGHIMQLDSGQLIGATANGYNQALGGLTNDEGRYRL